MQGINLEFTLAVRAYNVYFENTRNLNKIELATNETGLYAMGYYCRDCGNWVPSNSHSGGCFC